MRRFCSIRIREVCGLIGQAPRPRLARYEIEALLIAELTSARAYRKQTAAEFLWVMRETPYGSPSDGLLRMSRASDANGKAMVEYEVALKRLSNFIVDGIVPDDLK
jgi:hypothetical protein